MGWHSVRRWPIAALLFTMSFASSAQQLNLPNSPSSASTSVSERVTIVGMVPIPDVGPGAPRYSSADIRKIADQAQDLEFRAGTDLRQCRWMGHRISFWTSGKRCNPDSLAGLLACEQEYARATADLAGKAVATTKEAEAVRREAAGGRAGAAAVEAAELKRQDAVNKMQAMREKLADARANIGVWQDAASFGGTDVGIDIWGESARRKRFQDTPGALPGLRIEGVQASPQDGRRSSSVLVQGSITNTSSKPTTVSGLVAMLIDERNWIVARQAVTPDKKFVVAGNASKPFALIVDFAPQATRRAVVMFAHETEAPPRLNVGRYCSRAFFDTYDVWGAPSFPPADFTSDGFVRY